MDETAVTAMDTALPLPHCQALDCPARATKVVWDTYLTPGDADTLETAQVASFYCALHFACADPA